MIQRMLYEFVLLADIVEKIELINALMTILGDYNKIFYCIINYVNKKLSDEQQTYKLSTLDYQTRLNSINQNSMINDVVRANLISTIPPPSGFNISDDDIMVAINKITNNKNANFATKLFDSEKDGEPTFPLVVENDLNASLSLIIYK